MPHADSSFVPPEVTSKAAFRVHVHHQLQCLLQDQRHWVTNLANASSLIYNSLLGFNPHFGNGDRAVNWWGFYLISSLFPKPRLVEVSNQSTSFQSEITLLLGPFCGKPACQFINVSPGSARGVCAAAFLQQETILVPNVHKYPGHIACDEETKSGIGVLDLDYLVLDAFDEEDKLGLETIVNLIVKSCDW